MPVSALCWRDREYRREAWPVITVGTVALPSRTPGESVVGNMLTWAGQDLLVPPQSSQNGGGVQFNKTAI